MMHAVYAVHIPFRYWCRLYPQYMQRSPTDQLHMEKEHRDELIHTLSLPGLQARVIIVHKEQGEYEIQRIRAPWLYHLWWWCSGKEINKALQLERDAAIEKYKEDLRL